MATRTPSRAAVAFENAPEITTPVTLTVQGHLPSWLSGALYRNGPGTFRPSENAAFDVQHWFDGLGMVHRFDIVGGDSPSVSYTCRRTAIAREEQVQQPRGWPERTTFAQARDPCESYFAKFKTFFWDIPNPGALPRNTPPDGDNVNVALLPGIAGLGALVGGASAFKKGHGRPPFIVATTDANRLQVLDSETLQPLAISSYDHLDPVLDGQLTASHACVDPDTSELFNFVLKLGPKPTYTIFRTTSDAAGPGEVTILAKITDAPGAYIHSFALTKKYAALCVWQADYTQMGISVVWNRNVAQSIASWNPNRATLLYVIDRERGGVVGKYTAPTFFAFHTINAYDSGNDLILDLIVYPNTEVIQAASLASLRAPEELNPAPEMLIGRARRFRLADISGGTLSSKIRDAEELFTLPQSQCIELPAINPRNSGKCARFAYGVSRAHPGSDYSDQLIKLDLSAAETSVKEGRPADANAKVWFEENCTPGEPIFVPGPDQQDEEDGVLLSVVLDGKKGRSMLLCLDARTMEEVSRAEMDTVFPMGFHGMFVR